jgi:hypothetical protein
MTPLVELLIAALLIVFLAYLVARIRRRRTQIRPNVLAEVDTSRYRAMMEEALLTLDRDPQQAAAQARGIVEEAMRRRGFPDRIDAQQRVKDLRAFNRDAAAAYESAGASLATGGAALGDAVQRYREALEALLH